MQPKSTVIFGIASHTPGCVPYYKLHMTLRYKEILEKLQVYHGRTMLGNFGQDDPWQTLIATILSARSRDETTEVVARGLFKVYPDCASLANAPVRRIEKLIKKTGFYKTKARRIINVSKLLMEKYGGKVPSDMDALLELPGVGRKTASCVLVYAFARAAIPVDTHVHRISNRLGWVRTKTPEKTELALRKRIGEDHWLSINDLFVFHGKTVCKPIRPLCSICVIEPLCAKRIKINRRDRKDRRGINKKNNSNSATSAYSAVKTKI
ncbi:MAG TPA: endonuclease III [Acidobacteriota bacterium]|nr:endonuclease III [Acidobacteriota bacterium]